MQDITNPAPAGPNRLVIKLFLIAGIVAFLGIGLVLIIELVQDRIYYQRTRMTGDKAEIAAFIDSLRMVDRAVKYGIGLILATYGVLFSLEALGRARVHLMHYASVGAAMAMFYMLLLSIFDTTHDFDLAYIVASALVIGLNAYYLAGNVTQGARGMAIAGGGLVGLYGVNYLLLAQSKHALLTGTLVGFGLLAAFMITTRRLDWNRLGTGAKQ
jgi:inner membrane protein